MTFQVDICRINVTFRIPVCLLQWVACYLLEVWNSVFEFTPGTFLSQVPGYSSVGEHLPVFSPQHQIKKKYKNSSLLWDGELCTESLVGNKCGITPVEGEGSRTISGQMPLVYSKALFARRDARGFPWTKIINPLYPDIHKVQTINRGMRL